MSAHLTISATEFKATCLDIFTRLSDHRLERVTVTRRGKPVAAITSPEPVHGTAGGLYGCLAGTVSIPASVDLTAPIIDLPEDAQGDEARQ